MSLAIEFLLISFSLALKNLEKVMKAVSYNIEVRDSVKNPYLTETPKFKREFGIKGEYNNYKVWIYLEGPDLPFIKRVTYRLHPTFKHQVRTIESSPSNPKCALQIWTWGIFTVKAEIEDVGGKTFELEHLLTYGEEISRDKSLTWEASGSYAS